MSNPSHSYLLRSTLTSQQRIQENKGLANTSKQLKPLNTQLQHKREDKVSPKKTIKKMASKEDIVDLLKKHNKTRKSFEPQEFSGKITENEKDFMTSFNNYNKLNNVDGAEKILTFEMCLTGTAKCWFAALSDEIQNKSEKIHEQLFQNNKWLNTTRLNY